MQHIVWSYVKKTDAHLRKPLPFLCHICITNEALEDTNAAEDP